MAYLSLEATGYAVDFLTQLRMFLQRVDRGGVPELAGPRVLTEPVVRRFFLEAIDERQRAEATRAVREDDTEIPGIQGWDVAEWFSHWMRPEHLSEVGRQLEIALRAGIGHDADPRGLEALSRRVVRRIHLLEAADGADVTALEIERISGWCLSNLGVDPASGTDAQLDTYARDTRLVRGFGTKARVTPLGEVWRSLPVADSVRWLLCLEMMEPGKVDRARYISVALLAHMIDDDGFPISEGDPSTVWPFNTVAFDRLRQLGVISLRWGAQRGYRIHREFRDFVEELVEGRRSPLSLLAETLLAEERGLVGGHAPVAVAESRAGEIQAQHARMVLHEVRNALVPMRSALTQLSRTLEREPAAEGWQTPRDRIAAGIDRLFRFASDLEQVAELGASPPTMVGLEGVIRDALASLNGGIADQTRLALDAQLPPVFGHRERLTLVFVNLLRNALQNHPQARPQLLLAATLTPLRDAVEVTVDDDGPGVPEAHRASVFQRGFSLRPGGSGQGLALVREVIEDQMRGAVHCGDSPLGGARFSLRIPVTNKVQP